MTPLTFSPGSITCFFVPSIGATVAKTSSAGCGINVSLGVTASVASSDQHRQRLNGNAIAMTPLQDVVARLAPHPVEVELETPLPIGAGFGVSAACCLAAAFAIDKHFGLSRTRDDLGRIALAAEISHRTGIGDVVSQLTGGVVWRRWRSGPFDAERLDLPAQPLFARTFESLSTSRILGSAEIVAKVAAEGRAALTWLEANRDRLTLSTLLARSKQFAEAAGLIQDTRVANAIRDVESRGGSATMIMLGQSVVATLPLDDTWTRCDVDSLGTRTLP